MDRVFKSQSARQTKKFARDFAKKINDFHDRTDGAIVFALEGDLGAGKTTFVQGFATALGIKENVLSPTFVLMKVYKTGQRSNVKSQGLRHFIHIDCYRLDSPKDLSHLGFEDLLKDKDAVILIEWADRIKKLLPKDTIWINFKHGKKQNERIIGISN